jgi:hypothetical protein
MEYVAAHLSDYEYMLVMDMDLEGGTNVDGFLHSIGIDNHNWDAIVVDGQAPWPGRLGLRTKRYDTLASAMNEKEVEQCRHEQRLTWWHQMKKEWRHMDSFNNKTAKVDPISVKSGFNGMALYKTKSILKVRYDGQSCCEHVSLHYQMAIAGCGRIWLNPLWVLYTGHQGPHGWQLIKQISTLGLGKKVLTTEKSKKKASA